MISVQRPTLGLFLSLIITAACCDKAAALVIAGQTKCLNPIVSKDISVCNFATEDEVGPTTLFTGLPQFVGGPLEVESEDGYGDCSQRDNCTLVSVKEYDEAHDHPVANVILGTLLIGGCLYFAFLVIGGDDAEENQEMRKHDAVLEKKLKRRP